MERLSVVHKKLFSLQLFDASDLPEGFREALEQQRAHLCKALGIEDGFGAAVAKRRFDAELDEPVANDHAEWERGGVGIDGKIGELENELAAAEAARAAVDAQLVQAKVRAADLRAQLVSEACVDELTYPHLAAGVAVAGQRASAGEAGASADGDQTAEPG
ncbi:unnamed protein product [Prorocentrum cordatum]|uniref:Uncharacterized protein n=1 Tax=Prorocentrum cordatum TaxID=2364126 RepID=A0ABN9SYV7_9DINO|nr:unnamed protein product [Polarella glacialis]